MANILIIDDDQDISDMVSLRLSLRGHVLQTQGNGHDGVTEALRTKPDLILMDMQMPGIKGEEAVKMLRQKSYDGIIILLSAAPIPSQLKRTLNVQCNGYISKPIERSFEDLIERYLETSHA